MTQIAQGAHAYINITPGQTYRVQADGVATVQVLYGAPSSTVTLTAESRAFGPYDADVRIKITATTGAAEYTLLRAQYVELTQAQIEGGAVGALASDDAGGVIEPDGDVPTLGGEVTLPAMQTAFNAGTAQQKAAFQSSVSMAREGGLTIGAVGNSIAAYSGLGPAGLAPESFQATGMLPWLVAATCGRYRIRPEAIYGYSGQNSDYIAAAIPTWVNFADETFLHLWENDIVSALTKTQIETYAHQIMVALKGRTRAIICTCLPSLSYTTTAHRDKFNFVNMLAYRLGEQYGAPVVNVSDYYLNPTGAGIPSAISTWVDAGVHPRIGGAQVFAYGPMLDALRYPTKSFFLGGTAQGTGTQSAVPNGFFNLTQAASGTNISGTVPQSWPAQAFFPAGSAGSLTCSMRQRADRVSPQQWCDLRYVSDKGSSGDCGIQATNYFWTAGDFAAGDVVEFMADFEVTGTPIGLQNIDIQAGYLSAARSHRATWMGYGNAQAASPVWAAPRGTLRTMRYTMTASDITNRYLSVYLKLYAISAATPVDFTVGFANPRIVKVG